MTLDPKNTGAGEATAPPIRIDGRKSRARRLLHVTRYDRVAALLVALLVIVGLIVVMMFTVWVSDRVWIKQAAVAAQMIEPLAGGGSALGSERELVDPGEEELEEMLEPELEETIDAVTDLMSNQLATMDVLGGDAQATSAGAGAGDGRIPGEGGEGDTIPRWQRWQIHFAAGSRQAYAQQLDAFGIELGAVGGTDQIDYAYNLSQPQPSTRSGLSANERRMYMTWRYGKLKRTDTELLQLAGVRTTGRIIMQFIPPRIEAILASAELAYASEQKHQLEDIARTIFRVVPDGDAFGFEVESQETRR